LKIIALDINNLTDARYFAAWNVNILGLNISPGDQEYISPEYFHALQEWIEGPAYALQIKSSMIPELEAFAKMYKEDAYLIFNEKNSDYPKSRQFQIVNITQFENFHALRNQIEILSEQVSGIILECNDQSWEDIVVLFDEDETQWMELLKEMPIFINLNFSQESIQKFISHEIHGICLRGGEEEKVGVKSYDEIDIIFESIESFQNQET
jgi:phosphoribosylanthranilate isomerase